MNPKVSVIVPVYGAEAFLPTCISSLRAQTLRDIELIFVCDGSPDHSLAILRRVEPLDSRIRVIAFEENQGVSAARNAGLDAARGDYIGFCDGDDWAEPQMYETLLRAAEEAGADVAFCRVFKDRGEAREDVPLGFDDGTVFSREEIGRTLIPAMLSRATDSDELPLSGYTPRNLFRREAIGSHRFRPDIRYAEDLLFIVACMKDARCAVAVDRAYYHYRFHSGSVTKHFSFHVPESYEKSNDALEALLAAKAAGKIGHIGVTAHMAAVFEKALTMDWVETVMFPYNIVEDQAKELIHACAEKNIGFIAMKPLAGGAIEDAVTALRYVCANPDVTVVIPGMADVAELNQNLAAVNDSSPLSVEEEAKMRAIRDALGTQFCRRCNYCQPCSAGISISSVFLFEGYLSRYGLADWARSRYATLTKKASECIGCGACESRCPYHLPIRSMLKEAAEKFGE